MLGVGGVFVADIIRNADQDNGARYDLIVSVNPPGSGSVSPGGDLYDSGTPVPLTATASTGYQFYKWSGDASGTSPTITVTMDSDKSVTAYFIPVEDVEPMVITVTEPAPPAEVKIVEVPKNTDVTLSTLVSPDRSGTISRNPDKDKYEAGARVTMTATPASGHRFVSWSGDPGSNTNPITITMDGNKVVTASFAINTYTITASAGSGGSINPSSQVTAKYGANQSFSITPDTGYHIHEILVDGASVGVVSSYTFTNVTADHSIVASFTQNKLTLSVNINGSGSVTKNPDQTTYSHGAVVTLTAIPVSSFRFDRWSGDTFGTSPTITITMDSDKSVTASFTRVIYTLTTSVSPGGSGTINPSSGSYDSDTRVTLTATPASGYVFDRWSGDASGTSTTITITMDRDKSVVANFKEIPPQIIIFTMPPGSISTSWVKYSKYLQTGEWVIGTVQLEHTGSLPEIWSYAWKVEIFDPADNLMRTWTGDYRYDHLYPIDFLASYNGVYKIKVSHWSTYSKTLRITIRPPGWG